MTRISLFCNTVISLFPLCPGLHLAGGVASALLLPLDIYCVVSDSIALHTGKPEEYSQHLLDMKVEVLKSVDQLQSLIQPGLEISLVELEDKGQERAI